MAVALGLALACAAGQPEADDVCATAAGEPARRPDLVVVVADTLRADFLGHGGLGGGISPSVDAFAGEAVEFRSAFAQAPWTKPSVASLFTGLHPQAHGVTNHGGHFWSREGDDPGLAMGVLPGRHETFAEALRDAGYLTAGFVANEWLTPGYGFDQGFEHYEPVDREPAGAVFGHAADWLAQRDRTRPLLLYVHGMEVHGPYEAPEPLVETARASPGLGASQPLDAATLEKLPDYLRQSEWTQGEAARDLREWRARYAAGVGAFDRGFARLFEALEREGLLATAAVVVTADHGEELGEHGGWDHGRTLFDHQLHVPLLVRLPGGREAGRHVEDVVSLVDLHPTLLELAGADPVASHGASLLPLVCGEPDVPERVSLASATKGNPDLFSLRTRRHKLVLNAKTGAGAFFDLEADPGEQRDSARAHRAEANPLAQQLFAHVQRMAREATPVEVAPVDPELVAELEALGYIE